MDIAELQESVQTREDLARFVHALRHDLLQNDEAWENVSLEHFLGALGAWISDMAGWYKNQGVGEPSQPDWNIVAQMLLAASMYE